ncbi:type VI secretion system baseplate subunit TssE [Paracoccus sp. (in: a-proteobacteria)]|uniref:type VI secretion system baseplate subunit TssE n=1 Tax=Paracoccus sp. TaxID=267 RepID=UPI003A83EB15
MAERPRNELPVSTLLDRLIDFDPDMDRDPPAALSTQPSALREALRRDLEMLLNTRCRFDKTPAGLDQLDDSLLSLGVGDFFSSDLVTTGQRNAFAADLQRRIALFEPRLEQVSVSLQHDSTPENRVLHLRIVAEFRPRSGLAPVIFESRVDPVGGRFSVSEGRHG